jgi:NitT/TauT family transport system ATP-binding protein
MSREILTLSGIYQKYPNKDGSLRTILSDINLKIRAGEFITMVGPSGCGKSTLLRMILGSEKPYAGTVLMNGIPIQEPDRSRGVVFQHYSLFPNRTVLENVMFGLELEMFSLPRRLISRKYVTRKSKEFKEQAMDYLDKVGLIKDADRYPHQLSGGMRQRAAIAQSMIMKPQVLLMDEPHGALDVGTREEMQLFVLEQWEKQKLTIIFVTHELEEAIYIGSRIIVLSQFYKCDNGDPADGAKIVKDCPVPWPLPRPTDIKHTPEFNQFMKDIRHEGLDETFLQHIKDFDIRVAA